MPPKPIMNWATSLLNLLKQELERRLSGIWGMMIGGKGYYPMFNKLVKKFLKLKKGKVNYEILVEEGICSAEEFC